MVFGCAFVEIDVHALRIHVQQASFRGYDILLWTIDKSTHMDPHHDDVRNDKISTPSLG